MSEHVVERTALPDELICTAEGRLAFNEQSQRVIPVTSFPDQAVNDASQQLVQCHSASFPTQRILMQVCCAESTDVFYIIYTISQSITIMYSYMCIHYYIVIPYNMLVKIYTLQSLYMLGLHVEK